MGTLAVKTKTLHGIKRVPQCYHLVKSYNILDQELWDTHWFSYISAVANINSNIELANNLSSDCDLFDIKLKPNLLGIKIYTGLLKSQAQLDNIKSISSRDMTVSFRVWLSGRYDFRRNGSFL